MFCALQNVRWRRLERVAELEHDAKASSLRIVQICLHRKRSDAIVPDTSICPRAGWLNPIAVQIGVCVSSNRYAGLNANPV
jgi:hypothetical protein